MPGRKRPIRPSSQGSFVLGTVLFAVWLAVNSSLRIDVVIAGIVICAALACAFSRDSIAWRQVCLSPRAIYHFVAYTAVFFVELVRANFNVMRYVYSPRIDIRPGIVKIKTCLKSPIGRLALANSIALTPGSLVIDLQDDTLFVHWLDIQTLDTDEATRMIAGPFEKHLEAVFG